MAAGFFSCICIPRVIIEDFVKSNRNEDGKEMDFGNDAH